MCSIGKGHGDIGTALDHLIQAFDQVGAVHFDSMLPRKGHKGQHTLLTDVHQICQLRQAGAQSVCDALPGFASLPQIGLVECLTDCGGYDGILSL